MKTSIKSTSKFLTFFLLASSSWAASVGRISDVKGHAFTILHGETKVIKKGDELPDGAELISEEGSQVSFNDFFDHNYHLSGSAHISLKDKNFELKRGYLWVQSFNSYNSSQIKTANSVTSFKKSEFILSFDNNSGRSQVLAVTGPFDFANIHEAHLTRSIDTGNFSFVDKDYEQGMPRKGTLIGYQSYTKIVGLFSEVKPTDGSVVAVIKGQSPAKKGEKEESFARDIASVSGESDMSVIAKPEVKVKQAKKLSKIKPKVERTVAVKVYGLESEMMETMMPTLISTSKPESSGRMPASVSVEPVKELQTQFEQSLEQEKAKQPRHGSDVNNLIDELKSYQSDFNKDY